MAHLLHGDTHSFDCFQCKSVHGKPSTTVKAFIANRLHAQLFVTSFQTVWAGLLWLFATCEQSWIIANIAPPSCQVVERSYNGRRFATNAFTVVEGLPWTFLQWSFATFKNVPNDNFWQGTCFFPRGRDCFFPRGICFFPRGHGWGWRWLASRIELTVCTHCYVVNVVMIFRTSRCSWYCLLYESPAPCVAKDQIDFVFLRLSFLFHKTIFWPFFDHFFITVKNSCLTIFWALWCFCKIVQTRRPPTT